MQFVQYNWLYLLICIIIFMMMLWSAHPEITYYNPRKNNTPRGVFFFFLLYIIISVWGVWAEDTYHIWDGFIDAGRFYNFEIIGYEAIYNWLGTITGDNYFLWRFIIWAPACLFMYFTAKKLNLLNRNFLVSLALIGGFLAYTRGMLGHAMLIYGIVVLGCSKNDNSIIGGVIGVLFIIGSYFFHKSMYINMLFAILALVPFGKRIINLSIPIFPIVVVLASMTVDFILAGEIDVSYGEGVGGVGDRTIDYLEREKSEITLFGYIGKVIQLFPVYLTVFYLYNRIYIKKILNKINNGNLFKYLYRLTYVALYISSAYIFVGTSEWISSRFMYMSYFPLVFVLGKVWSLEPQTNYYIKFIILSQIFALSYTYLYKILKWYAL